MTETAPAGWLWTPVVAYLAFIYSLSSIAQTPAFPGGSDKFLHAVLYAGLAATLLRAFTGGWRRPVTPVTALQVVVAAAAYGVSDEFHQWLNPPRTPDALDLLANTAGAAVSAGGFYLRSRFIDAPRGPV